MRKGAGMTKLVEIKAKGIEYKYGYDTRLPDDLDTAHCHDAYEILFVVSGTGKYVVEGTTFDIKPITLMVIRPFEYHHVLLDPAVPYERYVLKFDPAILSADMAARFADMMSADADVGGKYYSAYDIRPEIFSIFDRFEFLNVLPDAEKNSYSAMLLSEIMLFLSACRGEQMLYKEDELGAKVIRYLNENIHRNISLDNLARRFFVSKYHLCRAFKKHNGISVHGYINKKRVMYAKRLIESGETASGAAYRVGFGDYSSFYRAYVKVLGKAPTSD